MLSAVSSREITEWQAFEAENGPVWLRPDWGPALMRFTFANLYRDTKKHPDPFELEEFLIGSVPKYEPTPEQMTAIMDMTAAAELAREANR